MTFSRLLHHVKRRLDHVWTRYALRRPGLCIDGECDYCAEIDCPFGEFLHYHHDGCPACLCSKVGFQALHEFSWDSDNSGYYGLCVRCGVPFPGRKWYKVVIED